MKHDLEGQKEVWFYIRKELAELKLRCILEVKWMLAIYLMFLFCMVLVPLPLKVKPTIEIYLGSLFCMVLLSIPFKVMIKNGATKRLKLGKTMGFTNKQLVRLLLLDVILILGMWKIHWCYLNWMMKFSKDVTKKL